VLGVTALGRDLADARDRAYHAVGKIRWDDEHHRTDIALDAVTKINTNWRTVARKLSSEW